MHSPRFQIEKGRKSKEEDEQDETAKNNDATATNHDRGSKTTTNRPQSIDNHLNSLLLSTSVRYTTKTRKRKRMRDFLSKTQGFPTQTGPKPDFN
ncbi:unnamed protein product [Microthlaspi erraticum]|uniref:Uncharacterized protein n=1 Tax=Microthlaspi erraticum TaxID=1685480 RepID=A0A6D2HTK2_9BRAS|nr:unnamed protein product [Microthlaspi erraticum]